MEKKYKLVKFSFLLERESKWFFRRVVWALSEITACQAVLPVLEIQEYIFS